MLSTSNIAIQFGAKPLFEQVTVKFSDGNRYGLIGANGCGKSTLMKILGGDQEASVGDVMLQAGLRMGKLNQNQFGYEDERVLDVVMQGHTELWQAMTQRDLIYADAHASDDDYMRAAELEAKFAEYGGYSAEARAGSILTRCRHRRVAAQRADASSAARIETAGAAGTGTVFQARRVAAGRTDQQPGHQLHPLARRGA